MNERLVILLSLLVGAAIFAYYKEKKTANAMSEKKRPVKTPVVDSIPNRYVVLEQVLEDLRRRKQEQLSLPEEKQNKWLLRLIDKKIREIEAEFTLQKTL